MLAPLYSTNKGLVDEPSNMVTRLTAPNNPVKRLRSLSAQSPIMPDSLPSLLRRLLPELRPLVYHHIMVDDSNQKVIRVSNEILDYIFGMFCQPMYINTISKNKKNNGP
jgi:hypothetical protein